MTITMVYAYTNLSYKSIALFFIGSMSDLDSSTVVFLYLNTMC